MAAAAASSQKIDLASHGARTPVVVNGPSESEGLSGAGRRRKVALADDGSCVHACRRARCRVDRGVPFAD